MSEAGTDHRGGLKRSLNEFGAVGLCFATLLGSGLEAGSADRPASLAADEHYSALQTSDAALIGVQPEDWQARDWINSQPLTLDSLRGRVVLVRWNRNRPAPGDRPGSPPARCRGWSRGTR